MTQKKSAHAVERISKFDADARERLLWRMTSQPEIVSGASLNRGNLASFLAVWLRLPRPGTRCPVSGLSRTSLTELATPCARNRFRPLVQARTLKRKNAARGILLINRDSLLEYLSGLPTPGSEKETG